MQFPDTLLPIELRWKVQSFLRTPLAELVEGLIEKWNKDKWQVVRNAILMTNGDVDRVSGLIRWLEESYTFQGFALSENRLLTVVSEASVSDTESNASFEVS